MARFILRRLLIALVQLAGITVAIFFIIRWLPADPVSQMVGLNASVEAQQQAAHALGLDRGLLQQFGNFVGIHSDIGQPGLLQGSLGTSWVTSQPVLEEILQDLPITLQIVTYSLLAAFLLALPLGLAAARKPGGIADRIALVWGLFAGAQPDYWWGLLFIYVFFFIFDIAPAPMGQMDPMLDAPSAITGFLTIDALLAGRFDVWLSALSHLVLPVLTLVFVVSGAIVKMVRTNTLRALRSDYVLYARASGLPDRMVARYALRAALTPAITLVGIFYGILLSAAVTIEVVFSLNGIGQYAVRSILAIDYPAIQGIVLVVAVVSLLIYLLLDIVHAVLDPRIRT
jgi:ABC-type dipeptide/oligopeptide/nickel transport system permease component